MTKMITALMSSMAIALAGIGCGDDGTIEVDSAPEVDTPTPRGTISLSWEIRDQNDTVLTCAEVGALLVRLAAIPTAGGSGTIDAFNCDSGSGTSVAIDVGEYRAEVRLEGSTMSDG
ncbi:MAG: hypothetical protein AAGC55_32520, partial [Myxococcota bacterium]